MSKYQYTVNINQPCSQHWGSMKPDAGGRYCEHCTKKVIDFSTFSDQEILRKLQQADGKVCGRFQKSQLQNPVLPPESKPLYARLYKILAGLFLFTFSKNTFAYTSPITHQCVENLGIQENYPDPDDHPGIQSGNIDSLPFVLKGTILDSLSNEKLIGVVINLKNTNHVVFTDAHGKFILTVPERLLQDVNSLIISYVGYETVEFTFTREDFPVVFSDSMEFTMKISPELIIGDVAFIKEIRKHKKDRPKR